ncbi:2-nitropropane dioxygenase [Algimonas ampicilliniresistens]|uniref:2-nitropropane dioxygenase n=1 Tax=Algimonas ampicilliniresistens TaxID=1298735 RepID=A0ABQ5V9G4_9PROT|nr:nitronate monooxygenase family protein [Algimonas ampicilliniresistens]GLQ23384.1 2-nitropropane dioxygenase [Algimonas ampicilliniresistens]
MALPEILKKTRIPVVGAPLFIVSGPELVIAQCKAGIIGSFPALNARPAEMLEKWIVQIKLELEQYQRDNPDAIVAPYAVNQICHPSNDRLQHDMEICVKHEVPIIITSLQANQQVYDAAHSYGGIILHDVTNIRHTKKALSMGADGIIAVCNGAGGHAGTLSPFALIPEIREFFDGPILASGSISTGGSVAGAIGIGADMAYIGTRFIATEEANATPDYKQEIVDSTGGDIVYSSLFTGVHGNYLRGSIEKAGMDPDNLPGADKTSMNFGSGGNTDKKAWKDIWGAGQGVGQVKSSPPVAQVVNQMEQEFRDAIKRLSDLK